MAIALTPFLAFLSFLPLPTILLHLLTVPELGRLIPSELVNALGTAMDVSVADGLTPEITNKLVEIAKPNSAFAKGQTSVAQKEALKNIFEALMSTDSAKYQSAVSDLIKRYQTADVKPSEQRLVELVKILNEQYPGDIGVLCVFMLNVVELEKGQAAFLGADEPHAYLKGGELAWYLPFLCSHIRHYRVHGHVRQRRPRGPDSQAARCPDSRLNVDLRIR